MVKQQRPFDAAGGHHHALRPDLDVPLRECVPGPAGLDGGDQVVIVGADHRGSAAHPDVACGSHLFGQGAGPLMQGAGVGFDTDAVVVASAQPRARLEQNDPEAGFGRRQGRGHTGRPPADDAHIRMKIGLFEGPLHAEIRRNPPQTGRLADLLQCNGPQESGPVHGPVVKSHRHQQAQFVEKSHQVEFGRTDHVLGLDVHVRLQRCGFGANVGNPVDGHGGVGALPVEAIQAPGAVVFKAAPENPDAVCKHRCGHGVAGHAVQGLFSVLKREAHRRIDPQRRQVF